MRETETLDRLRGNFFTTVNKGFNKVMIAAMESPPKFKDDPIEAAMDSVPTLVGSPIKISTVRAPTSVVYTNDVNQTILMSLEVAVIPRQVLPLYPRKPESLYERQLCLNHRVASPRFEQALKQLTIRPSSRNLLSSRFFSSHNSLVTKFQPDDSSFITQSVSHNALSAETSDITNIHNVLSDSDIYAVPIETVRPTSQNGKGKIKKGNRRRGKSAPSLGSSKEPDIRYKKETKQNDTKSKRHSLPSSPCKITDSLMDSLNLTLRDKGKYLHTLFSSSSDSECPSPINKKSSTIITSVTIHGRHNKDMNSAVYLKDTNDISRAVENNNTYKQENNNTVATINVKNKKYKCKNTKEIAVFEKGKEKIKKIQIVKDYGWYWGPISMEAAEKILSNEPDGSFIVHDSNDDLYIFTITIKLNGFRHVKIRHNQGNFCFGGCTMIKAQIIVEFIKNAVKTSRSGRYLFFLKLRPVLGPVRAQLLYPVSRFKRVRSLQHLSRVVILNYVRRDLISSLPLARHLLDYLSDTHYYTELLSEI